MKKVLLFAVLLASISLQAIGQGVPELLYYKFDGTGTSVPNMASSPPTGAATGTIVGTLTQGSTGLCGGALIGVGGSGASNHVSTGWNTALGNSAWTIMFWTNEIPNTTTLYYQFGDGSASSFRCFNNGAAGATNWLLRGPVTDVPCIGCAPVGSVPSMTAFVYDPLLGNIKSYHNGVLNSTVSQGTLNINGSNFYVGGYTSSTGMGSGQLMDEFRLYNRALDANEVLLVYNQCLPLASSPNDAGIKVIDGPTNFCSDTLDITAVIRNYGTGILDSCIVNWELNGVSQPSFTYYGPLDTLGGSGPMEAQIVLGSNYFAPGTPYTVTAWTTMPNGVTDTVNFNDTASTTMQASLAGTMTIGGAGADYPDFTSAVSDLTNYGVCGPVIFNVYDTVYNEQIEIGAISGASATNTITFQAASGQPTMRYSGTGTGDNFVVWMSGGDHVTFDGITFNNTTTVNYGRVLYLNGGSNYNRWMNCSLIGDTLPTTTSSNIAIIYSNTDVDSANEFRHCLIHGGSYGAYWYGTNTTTLEYGTVFDDNLFLNQYNYGSRCYYQDGIQFTHNRVVSNTPYTSTTYGFFFGYADNGARITHNRVESGNNSFRYAFYMTSSDGAPGNENLVANNFIHVGAPGSTSTHYGMYISTTTYTRFYHNSINNTAGGTASRSVYFTSGSNNEFMNNNVKAGNHYALYINTTTALTNSDYNNLTTSGTNIAYYSGNHGTLASYQTASSWDANSISLDPMYWSVSDLHTCLDSLKAGTPLTMVTDDIDGDVRDTIMPTIGADEIRSPLAAGFLGPDSTICSNDSVLFQVGSPLDTVMWSNGSTGNTVWLSTPGVYYVDVSNPCWSSSDTVEIIASALVYSGFAAADTNGGCVGDTINIYSMNAYDTYSWSTGGTSQSIGVTAGGTYVVDVTDACGSGTDSVTIQAFNSAPVAGFSHTDTMFTCTFTNTSTAGGGNPTYSWDFGDGNTSTTASPSHTYAGNGNYLVTLVVTNECGSDTISDTCSVFVVALDAGMELPWNLYPNPAQNRTTLEADLTGVGQYHLTIVSTMGQLVRDCGSGEGTGMVRKEINLEGLSNGMYLLRLETEAGVAVRRLTIQRN